MASKRIVIIGAGIAATSAAQQAFAVDPLCQVILLYRGAENAKLKISTGRLFGPQHYDDRPGIVQCPGIDVTRIDAAARLVVFTAFGVPQTLTYDRLIVATGAKRTDANHREMQLTGVYSLDRSADQLAFNARLLAGEISSAIVAGSGMATLRILETLISFDVSVTVLTGGRRLEPIIDIEEGAHIEADLSQRGINIIHTAAIAVEAGTSVTDSHGTTHQADAILIESEWRPDTALAQLAGVQVGPEEAILVREDMHTNVPHIFAAGGCCSTRHRLRRMPTWILSDWVSRKQGLIAGENAAGGSAQFAGTVGTSTASAFALSVGRTGILENEAKIEGYDPLAVTIDAADPLHADRLLIRIIGDRRTGQLLGVQLLGARTKNMASIIDVAAASLFAHAPVERLLEFDLSARADSGVVPLHRAAELWLQRLAQRPKAPRAQQSKNGNTNSKKRANIAASYPDDPLTRKEEKYTQQSETQNRCRDWSRILYFVVPLNYIQLRKWVRQEGIYRRRSQVDDLYAAYLCVHKDLVDIPLGAFEVRKGKRGIGYLHAYLEGDLDTLSERLNHNAMTLELSPLDWGEATINLANPLKIGNSVEFKVRIRPVSGQHDKADDPISRIQSVDLYEYLYSFRSGIDKFSIYKNWFCERVKSSGIVTMFNIINENRHTSWFPISNGHAISVTGPDLSIDAKITITSELEIMSLLLNGIGSTKEFGSGFIKIIRVN